MSRWTIRREARRELAALTETRKRAVSGDNGNSDARKTPRLDPDDSAEETGTVDYRAFADGATPTLPANIPNSPYGPVGDPFQLNEVPLDDLSFAEENSAEEDRPTFVSSPLHVSSSSSDDLERNLNVEARLALIKAKTNCSLETIREFAQLLNDLGVKCAKDPRTILKTDVNIDMTDSFIHMGLRKGILENLSKADRNLSDITLRFNVDGIPLFKSSQVQFWPVLCVVTNSEHKHIFAVSVYCGVGKPPSLRDFLAPSLKELSELEHGGLYFSGRTIKNIIVDSVICDAPARSFIKAIKGHMGYGACERCVTVGLYVKKRIVFPDLDAPLRTDESFREGSDERHHVGVSPLEQLEGFDMIYGVPLDVMHLVHLGVMKKMLKDIWRGPIPRRPCVNSQHRLKKWQLLKATKVILKCKKFLPKREFKSRRGQSIANLPRWKAREYRLFLLYTGPLVLRKILPRNKYEHFIFLHVAMRVLSDPSSTNDQILYVSDILKTFVSDFGSIYGIHNLCYNVHSLIHLPFDCLKYGPCDSFSSYRFESFLGGMKRILRSSRKPLAQWARRTSELTQVQRENSASVTQSTQKYGDEYSCLNTVVPNSETDSFYLIRNTQTCIRIERITEDTIYGSQLRFLKNFDGSLANLYDTPVPASHLNVFMCDGFSRPRSWPKDLFRNSIKCVYIPGIKKDVSLVMPLLHFSH